MDIANYFCWFRLEGDAAEKLVFMHCLPGRGIGEYIHAGIAAGAVCLSHWRLLVI